MSERARALEQAELGAVLWKVSGWIDTQGRGLFPQSPDYDKGWRVGAMQALEEVRAGIRDMLAVQPPPPAGTPTPKYQNVYIVTHYPKGGLRGIHDSQAGAEAEIAELCREYPDYTRQDFSIVCDRIRPNPPSGASPQAETSEPSVMGAGSYRQVQRDEEFIRFALSSAVNTLEEAGCACQPEELCALCLCEEAVIHMMESQPAPVSPVEPEPPDPMFVRWGVLEPSLTVPVVIAPGSPRRPVEPEPPTTCRCVDCEPLTDPGPKPSEDDINRLEKAAWASKTDRVLVWYRDRAEMFRQRLRETERAWQLDRKKPTVEPEPCVWRDIATVPKDGTRILLTPAVWTAERVVSAYYRLGMWWIESADARGSIRAFTDPDEDASHWPFTNWTPLPGAPLKVEREQPAALPTGSPAPLEPQVPNLMDALKKSLDSLKRER